jgi:BolA protein
MLAKKIAGYFSKIRLIDTALRADFPGASLDVQDESRMHSKGTETHFRVSIVSSKFQGQSLVARHQAVYKSLTDAGIMSKVHAVGISARTPDEQAKSPTPIKSPPCTNFGSK